jgi:hypothetical protein
LDSIAHDLRQLVGQFGLDGDSPILDLTMREPKDLPNKFVDVEWNPSLVTPPENRTNTLFYSLYVDPLWSVVNGFSWAVAFVVVTISPFRLKTILLPAGALGCCAMLFVASEAAGYPYTLSQ